MSANRIEIGDFVTVNFNNAQTTLCHRARVEYMPQATGDSWRFFDLVTGKVHYVSEGCTISKIGEREGLVPPPPAAPAFETFSPDHDGPPPEWFTELCGLLGCGHTIHDLLQFARGKPHYRPDEELWGDGRALQVDSYATGHRMAHAHADTQKVCVQITDGHQSWRADLPLPKDYQP